MSIEADTKDWTWVLDRRCEECGFDPSTVTHENLPQRLAGSATPWRERLGAPDALLRPLPSVWSPTEYAAHVRDVAQVMATRLRLILDEDDPLFGNWDQDAAAIADRYEQQQPQEVLGELVPAVQALADAFAAVAPDQWDRPGRRSNGSVFTAFTLGTYALHDLEHHVHDVARTA